MGGEKKNDPKLGARPCIIVQNDGGNAGSPLTIVAPLNDMSQAKGYRAQVVVSAAELGLGGKDCVVECGHIRSIDGDARIRKHLGKLDAKAMERIDLALKASLGLK